MIAKRWKSFRAQFRSRRTLHFLAWSTMGALVLAAWLLQPLYRDERIRVPGSNVTINISCIPGVVSLDSPTGYLEMRRARLMLIDTNSGKYESKGEYPFDPVIRQSGHEFEMTLTVSQQSQASQLISAQGGAVAARLMFEFERVPSFELSKISLVPSEHPANRKCDRKEYLGSQLDSAIAAPSNHKVVAFLLPQEEVADFLLLINDVLGAILICTLLLAILWLLSIWGQGLWNLFFASPDDIRSRISKRQSALADQAEVSKIDVVRADYENTYARLEFVRVLGPAVGFMLTVSSLVSGLHPSVQSTQDSFAFVSSLQLALVATFVGLLTRVIAEFAIRVQRSSAQRDLFEVGSKKR